MNEESVVFNENDVMESLKLSPEKKQEENISKSLKATESNTVTTASDSLERNDLKESNTITTASDSVEINDISNRSRSSSSSSSISESSELTLITAVEPTNDILINDLVDIPIPSSPSSATSPNSNKVGSPNITKKSIFTFLSASKVHQAYASLEASSKVTSTEKSIVKSLHKTLVVIKNIDKRTALGHIIGALKSIILIINNNFYNEQILKNCLKIISHLSKNEITRKAFGDYGLCETMVQGLYHHTNSEAIARYGLRSISNLVYENDINRQKLFKAGVCDLVLKLISNNINSKHVAFRGVWAISNLCFVDNDIKSSIGRLGCDLSLLCMSLHQVKRDMSLYMPNLFISSISVKVAEWGCRCIVDLAEKNPTNQCYLGEIGACDEVVRCLEAYPSYTGVVKWSMAASATLMADNILNIQKFSQLKLTQLVLKQLRQSKYSDALLTEIGLAALYHLSQDQNSKREIIESDGVRLVKSLPERLGNRNDCLISLTCGMI